MQEVSADWQEIGKLILQARGIQAPVGRTYIKDGKLHVVPEAVGDTK